MNLKVLSLLLIFPLFIRAQSKLPQLPHASNLDKYIADIARNPKINADSALHILKSYNTYPVINQTGINYAYYYNDSIKGTIPLRIYIPASYKNNKRSACVIQLHGAVSQSKFSYIDSLTDEGIMLDPLKSNNYIIIQPLGDRDKGFTWGANRLSMRSKVYQFNLTYKTLSDILSNIKRILNIDDNRVYAFGHSDGADGAIGLAVYVPSQFAGVVAYNTMFTNLFAHDYYIRNIQNRPVYEVHSDKDQLRRINVNRQIIDSIKRFDSRINYKEYLGYEHWDKHLSIDAPEANKFMVSVKRDPYQRKIFLETTQNSPYNSCDWLTITKVDTNIKDESLYASFEINYREYSKNKQQWLEGKVYNPLKSAVVKASFSNNQFNLQTSSTGEIQIKLSPYMVDFKEPIIVNINGKRVFQGKVTACKTHLLNSFKTFFDKEALWVDAIKFKIK
jgi:predicted esterase